VFAFQVENKKPAVVTAYDYYEVGELMIMIMMMMMMKIEKICELMSSCEHFGVYIY
jgi:hypothetical protein